MIYKDRGVPASLREARASDLKFAEKNALEMMSNLPFKSFNSDCIPDIMFERRSYCRDIPFLGVRRYYDTRGEETILSTIRSILATAPFEITLKVEKAESWVKCRPDSASVARGSQYFIQEAQSFKNILIGIEKKSSSCLRKNCIEVVCPVAVAPAIRIRVILLPKISKLRMILI